MKIVLFGIVLTAVNLAILLIVLLHVGVPQTGEVNSVIRSHAIELVDDAGRVRASILLQPASTGPDGKKYAESVLLRLIDPNGRPGVKIGTSVDGSGISLAGDSEKSEWSGVQLLADATGSSVILTNKDGLVESISPQ